VALAKETVELAFIAAIQHLAPLPRAVLVLRDVLGCSAKETARLLETTEASVNSALQRARAGLRESLPEDREAWHHGAEPTAAERELLARYVECGERADAEGLAALMHEDVRFSMPPTPGVWTGRSTVVQGWIDGGFGSEAFGSMRCVVTRANGQPAVAGYVRKPGDAAYEPLAIDVLRVQDGIVTEIVTFGGAVFEHFDLPATLSAAVGTR
jgi:RNA polymerase sigma-70 factor (ECF subfamily)